MVQPALIALGANQPSPAGGPSQTLTAAIRVLADIPGLQLQRASRLYAIPAFPAGSGPDFANAAAAFETALPAGEILNHLHRIEAEFARARDSRWSARSLDLDLLALGDQILPSSETWQHWHDLPLTEQMKTAPKQLILPHPRLQDRAFVLVPLADVAPGWVHPVLNQTVIQMRDALPKPDLEDVKPL